MEDKKYIIHHIDEELSALDSIQQIYEERNIEKYFIAYESNPRPHYHLLTFGTEKQYNAIMAKLKSQFKLVEKQKLLRQQNSKGGRCLYTRVKDPTRSYERFITYVQKEQTGLFKSKGFSEEYISELAKKSFKKLEPLKNMDILIEHLETSWKRKSYIGLPSFDVIQQDTLFEIYRYINETNIKLSLSKTAINNYYLNYLRQTQHYSIDRKVYLQMYFNSHLNN